MAMAKAASTLALMALLVNGETTSAPDVAGRGGEECLVVQGLPLQVQLNNGVSGKFLASTPVAFFLGPRLIPVARTHGGVDQGPFLNRAR